MERTYMRLEDGKKSTLFFGSVAVESWHSGSRFYFKIRSSDSLSDILSVSIALVSVVNPYEHP